MEKDIHPGPPGPGGEGAVLYLPTGKDRRGSMDVKLGLVGIAGQGVGSSNPGASFDGRPRGLKNVEGMLSTNENVKTWGCTHPQGVK